METHEHMSRNVSVTLGKIATETTQAIASQKEALDSLAKIVLDNGIALDYILAEQGGICTEVNCCSRAVGQGIKILVMQDSSAECKYCTRKYLQLGAKPSYSLSP